MLPEPGESSPLGNYPGGSIDLSGVIVGKFWSLVDNGIFGVSVNSCWLTMISNRSLFQ